MKTFFMEFAIVALLVSCLSAVGCKEEQAKPTLPRPVKVVTLRTLDPTVALRLTGVIEAWADQDVAFELFRPVNNGSVLNNSIHLSILLYLMLNL